MLHVFVQYGVPHSASTYQWVALCAIVALTHAPHTVLNMVYVDYRNKTILSEHVRRITEPGVVSVLKVHHLPQLMSDASMHDVLNHAQIIRSTRNRGEARKYLYTQVYDTFITAPTASLWDYRSVFNMSLAQTKDLVQFMKLFGILHQCIPVRNAQLRNVSQLAGHEHNKNDADYPDCDMYRMDIVFSKLLSTNAVVSRPSLRQIVDVPAYHALTNHTFRFAA